MNCLSTRLPQTLLDAIQNPFVIKNVNGIVVACNQAFQNLYKPGEKSIVGTTSHDFLPRKEADKHVEADTALLAGVHSHFDYRITRERSDGAMLHLDVHKSSSRSADGAPQILAVLNIKIQPCTVAQQSHLLSPREINVLELLVKGNCQKNIARALGITNHTVGDHLKSIYRKMGVTSRTQAQLKAIVELGIL